MNKQSKKLCRTALFITILCWGFVESANAQYFWNTDFEYGVYQSQPRKWAIEGEGERYTASLDEEVSYSGEKSLFFSQTHAEIYTFLSVPGELVSGRNISLTGQIKGQQTDSLQLRLLLFNPEEGNILASSEYDSVNNRWTPVALKSQIAENYRAENLLIALMSNGTGNFWFDAVRVIIDGELFGNDDPDFREPTNEEIAVLNERAVSFEMNVIENGSEDFEGLSEIIGDAQLVALGENSHGSASIYTLKLRMLTYLVERKGYSIFALEMPTVEADFINNYVMHGEGTIDEVLAKLTYPSWQTQEMIDIIQWMREYNLEHEKAIEFRGYDMQNGWSALNEVKEFADTYDQELTKDLETVDGLYESALDTGNPDQSLFDTSYNIARYLNEKGYPEVQKQPLKTIRHYMDIFIQSLEFQFQTENAKSRDEYMAENIRWIFEQAPDSSRMIISADNTHITEAGGKTGAFLDEWYNEDYLSVGFTYGNGTYSAYGSEPFYEVHPPCVGTYEYFFSKSRHKNFFLDLRPLTNLPILNQPSGFRSIGSRPQDVTQFYDIEIKNHFDVVVYQEVSTHTSYLTE